MATRLNMLIEHLQQKTQVFGTFIPTGSIEHAVATGDSAFDFCIMEMEHAGFHFPGLRDSLQYLINRRKLVETGSLAPSPTPLVRIPANAREGSEWMVKQALDYGVFGLVCPHLNTVEEAVHMIRAARYPQRAEAPDREPEGLRGTSPRNAMRYWGATSIPEYIDRADLWPLDPAGELLLMPLIEEVEGVRHIADILKQAKGIGAIFLGEVDLSVSLGHPMELDHPNVIQARDTVFKACKNAGVPVGCLGFPDNFAQRIEMGFDFVVIQLPLLEQARQLAGRA